MMTSPAQLRVAEGISERRPARPVEAVPARSIMFETLPEASSVLARLLLRRGLPRASY